jgi:glycosyltransferase involved in cell wall biosynthesis
MKILQVLYSGLGGHGNVFFSFISADENDINEYEAIFAGIEDIREEYISKSTEYNIKWNFIKKTRRLDFAFNKNFIKTVKASPASIILLNGSRLILAAKIATMFSKTKKKIVVTETQANHLKTKAEWVSLAFAMFLADGFVFLTESFKEEVRKKLPLFFKPRKITIINNGLDLDFFKPSVKPVSKTITIGMQSRIVPIKDHATLLHAFALLQHQFPALKLELKIAGDGQSLPEMRELAKELKIQHNIVFTGMLNEADLIIFLQSLDIYVHASLGETMSTAIMQAMACKLPIIASDVAGINNMIKHNETGILVEVRNETALANAIHFVITNPSKTIQLKESAYNFAMSNYSNKTMFAKYQSVFEGLTNKLN